MGGLVVAGPPGWLVLGLGGAVLVTGGYVYYSKKSADDKFKEEKPDAKKKCDCEEPPKKKKVGNSEEGEKVRTPETHPDDFTKQRGDQGYENDYTGETWKTSHTSHKGDTWKVFDRGGTRVGSVRPDGTIAGK